MGDPITIAMIGAKVVGGVMEQEKKQVFILVIAPVPFLPFLFHLR